MRRLKTLKKENKNKPVLEVADLEGIKTKSKMS
jgi:hypothetical protein